MFQVSDKVVCINDTPSGQPRVLSVMPVKGAVYVMRDSWEQAGSRDGWLIQLVGFPEVFTKSGKRRGFQPSRFRLLNEVRKENATKIFLGKILVLSEI